MATTNWPLEGMQHLLLDWHLLLAAPAGWGSGLVEGDSEGGVKGDPPCPLSLRQQRKWVMFVWKPRAAIPRFDVWATWDAGLRQHSGRGERKRNRTHTDLVLRTNNLSDKPAAIPQKSPNRWGIQTRRENKGRLGGYKGARAAQHGFLQSLRIKVWSLQETN